MLLLCSLLLTASGGQKAPQSVTGEGLGAGEGQWDGWGVRRSPTCIEGTVSDLELGFVLIGNVLPRGQENLPIWEEGGGKVGPW